MASTEDLCILNWWWINIASTSFIIFRYKIYNVISFFCVNWKLDILFILYNNGVTKIVCLELLNIYIVLMNNNYKITTFFYNIVASTKYKLFVFTCQTMHISIGFNYIISIVLFYNFYYDVFKP